MNRLIIIGAMLSATSVTAGGWEASRLDTKFMYEEGNYAEISNANLDYEVKADTRGSVGNRLSETSIKKSQNRKAFSFKTKYQKFDIGVSQFKSGTIQLDGNAPTYASNHPGCSLGNETACAASGPVPKTDIDIYTLALLGKVAISDQVDVLLGIKRDGVEDSTVSTSRGNFSLTRKSATAGMYGVTYSKPEIALRVELLMQPASKISAPTTFAASDYAKFLIQNPTNINPDPAPGCGVNDYTATLNTTMSAPRMATLNLQSGVAKDTLVYGSIHRVNWSSAQINADTGCVATKAASAFWDTTTYTIGAARKLSESLALTASFAKETGGNTTTTSLFTVNNGYKAFNLGARYKIGKVTISGGYNYTQLGDITVTDGTNNYAIYTNNKVSALGVKVGIAF